MSVPPEQMTEAELLERAQRAMLRAAALPPGSLQRSVQWGIYDTYADELRRRAIAVVSAIAWRERP